MSPSRLTKLRAPGLGQAYCWVFLCSLYPSCKICHIACKLKRRNSNERIGRGVTRAYGIPSLNAPSPPLPRCVGDIALHQRVIPLQRRAGVDPLPPRPRHHFAHSVRAPLDAPPSPSAARLECELMTCLRRTRLLRHLTLAETHKELLSFSCTEPYIRTRAKALG